MVVDDVEQHHQPALVRGLDERFQVLRAAVGRIRRIGQDAVVAPVPPARKIADRHDLDRGDAELDEMVELVDRGAERALGREGADMQFVENRLVPGPAAPPRIGPAIGRRVDHLARSVDIVGLIARRRIGNAHAVRQHETIARTGARPVGNQLVPAAGERLHR